jgi:hypothetical protein
MAGMDERQFAEMMEEIREEHRLHREELRAMREATVRDHERHSAAIGAMREEQKRRFARIDQAMENDRLVTREMLLELRDGRRALADIRHAIQSSVKGLLRVLDEMRRDDGPSPAGA